MLGVLSMTLAFEIGKMRKLILMHWMGFHVQERGAVKEEVFSRRLKQLWAAEQRLRIPIAQGLPWTTDEPEACAC